MLDPGQVDLADLAIALEDHSQEHSWWLHPQSGTVEPRFRTPELRRAWFRFHDGRSERRAIEWLVEQELIEPAAGEQALARNPEGTAIALPGLLDAEGVAHRVARDLRRHYGERLRTVLLSGLWAYGEPHPESALELLVVLDDVPDRWAEKAAIDRILWRHSIRHDTVVIATPVTDRELRGSPSPQLARARAHGVRVV